MRPPSHRIDAVDAAWVVFAEGHNRGEEGNRDALTAPAGIAIPLAPMDPRRYGLGGVRIVVTEHGVGNVRSVVRAIARVVPSADILVTGNPDAVRRADRIVVPGQGSFGAFAKAMHGGLGDALAESIAKGTPYLGICLGLQVLFEDSEEAPGERGLAVYRGRVKRIAAGDLALPHIGWNDVSPGGRFFYFAHSYVAVPEDPSLVAGTTEYGEGFASMIRKDNVLGVQFHPEKSQREGLALLERFFSKAEGETT